MEKADLRLQVVLGGQGRVLPLRSSNVHCWVATITTGFLSNVDEEDMDFFYTYCVFMRAYEKMQKRISGYRSMSKTLLGEESHERAFCGCM